MYVCNACLAEVILCCFLVIHLDCNVMYVLIIYITIKIEYCTIRGQHAALRGCCRTVCVILTFFG